VNAAKRTPQQKADDALISKAIDAVTRRLKTVRYSDLTEAERTLIAVYWLEAEVNNGGFDQYFLNSSGDHASDVPGALRRIGAERSAKLAERAIAVFPEPGPSPDRDTRHEQLMALSEDDDESGAFEALDEEFYRYADDLTALMASYAREHAADLPERSSKKGR
jgi:hypothetical protein